MSFSPNDGVGVVMPDYTVSVNPMFPWHQKCISPALFKRQNVLLKPVGLRAFYGDQSQVWSIAREEV